METRIQKWGNSLALRIPRSFAAEVGLSQNSPIELILDSGQLIIRPIRTEGYHLEELLSDVHPENLHHEVDTGDQTGNEAW